MPPKRNPGRKKKASNSYSGQRLRLPVTPPPFSTTPFSFLTLALEHSNNTSTETTSCLTVNDVLSAWKAQTGATPPASLGMRIQSVRIWEVARKVISATFDIMVDGTQCSSYSDTLATISDYPGYATFARVGYRYPLTSRQQTKTAAEGATTIVRLTLQPAGKALIYVDLLWTFGSASVKAGNSCEFTPRV